MKNVISNAIVRDLNLPEQLPWFGFEDYIFIGSGSAAGYGDVHGLWHNVCGTAYTMLSFVQKLKMQVVIDGEKHFPNALMHRADGTGIFYSVQEYNDVIVYLVDFTLRDAPWVGRMLAVQNTSDKPVTVSPEMELKRTSNYVDYVEGVIDPSLYKDAVNLTMDDKFFMTAAFAGRHNEIRMYEEENEVIMEADGVRIAPGATEYFTLYCYTYAADDGLNPQAALARINARNGAEDVRAAVDEWTNWLNEGIDLSVIRDWRARKMVEACSIIIRMEQGTDGGIMSAPGSYTTSYVRDNHCSLRGMMAAGHVKDAKQYLRYVNRSYHRLRERGQFGIPTSIPIGLDDLPFFGFGDEDNWSNESPGLYVLTAKRYFELTHDTELLAELKESIAYAVDVQLDFARRNDWKMIFNGDETESGGCAITMRESVTAEKRWVSLPSNLIAIASTRFALENGLCSDEAAAKEGIEKLTATVDQWLWNEKEGTYYWHRKQDGSPSKTRMCNYEIMPLYYNVTDRKKAESAAKSQLPFFVDGVIPNQALSETKDFVGHNLGYLLFAMVELGDPAADRVYNALVRGIAPNCWGMWAESYFVHGEPYGPVQTWDNRRHTLRPFESGLNMESIIDYWQRR